MNTYATAIDRVMADERLKPSERLFFLYFLRLLERHGDDALHWPTRELASTMHIASGSIVEAIPHLKELGYLRGELYPNANGHESWRLSLPESFAQATKPPGETAVLRMKDLKITVKVEKEDA